VPAVSLGNSRADDNSKLGPLGSAVDPTAAIVVSPSAAYDFPFVGAVVAE